MLGRISINGSVEWLGVPDFYRTNGPAWTDNILNPRPSWGEGVSTTNPNWDIQSGGILEVFPYRGIVLSVSFQFTTTGSWKTRVPLRVVSMTSPFWEIV